MLQSNELLLFIFWHIVWYSYWLWSENYWKEYYHLVFFFFSFFNLYYLIFLLYKIIIIDSYLKKNLIFYTCQRSKLTSIFIFSTALMIIDHFYQGIVYEQLFIWHLMFFNDLVILTEFLVFSYILFYSSFFFLRIYL